MLTKINYQKELDKLIDHLQKEEKVPTLLLHSCCAPCSSYVLEYLSSYFKITVLYYNPNIPDDWSKTLTDHGTVSCDISSLVNLQHWKDSVTIVVKSGDKEKHRTKISKNDFLKLDKH